MNVLRLNSIRENQANQNILGSKALEKPEKETGFLTAKMAGGQPIQREDRIEISLEGRLAAEQDRDAQEPAGSDAAEQLGEEALELAGTDTLKQTGEESQKPAEAERDEEEISEQSGGRVGVNEGKRARQIAAAQNRAQVQQVLALLQNDLAECKAGLEKGWCDESEIAKVEALLNSAKARLSQVPEKTDDVQGGLDAFAMASLM